MSEINLPIHFMTLPIAALANLQQKKDEHTSMEVWKTGSMEVWKNGSMEVLV